MKYERLRNLAMLVLVTAYFASVYLGKRAKLAILDATHRTSREANLRRS